MDIKITCRRWLDVVLLGLVGYALVYLIASFGVVQVAFGKWANLFSSLHLAVQILLALTGFYCARHLLLFFNVIHKRQLKNIKLCLAYPPITFSIVLCLLLFLPQFDVINFFSDSLFVSYFLAAALVFIILLSLLCAYDSLYGEKRKDKQESVLVPDWITDEEQRNHYRWLMSERPLDKSDKDMLGREVYVTRIARLFEPIDGERKYKANHIAIVGPFGIGKTNTCERVKKQLGDDYIFVSVDGWGRGEGTVAAQIIDEMVAKLTNYVDCASIRNVPKEYMAALSGADFKGISTLAKILPLHSHQSPEELIRKIETILLSIGKTMVVVLEDFDRNPQEENIMNEVAGLLDRLRDLRSINFIVCVAPGVKSHLLSRISTHREDLLSFDSREFVNATLDLMRAYAKFRRKPIYFEGEHEVQKSISAINATIKTPRDAKYALRRAFVAWESLAGEVNMYDLLAANVLRYSAPDVFDCMVENFNYIKEGVENIEDCANILKNPKEAYSTTQEYVSDISSRPKTLAFNKVLNRFPNVGVSEIEARLAIKILFPKWHSADGDSYRVGVQRVSGRQGKVYLDRIVSECISPEHEDESDAEFFSEIYNNTLTADNGFMNKLIRSDYWSVKFIEWAGNSCDMDHELVAVAERFTDFLVGRCNLRNDLMFDDLYPINFASIKWIINRLCEKVEVDVFKNFIHGMECNPEMLFKSLKKAERYREHNPQQYQLWTNHKSDLQKLLSKSSGMSTEARASVEAWLNEMDDSN